MSLPQTLTQGEIALLGDALSGRPTWLELGRALEATGNASGSEALVMLSLAFLYDLIDPGHEDRRRTAGGPYAPMWDIGTGDLAPRPNDLADKVRAVWRDARDRVDDPIVRGRIGDLLYVAEGKTAHQDARAGAHELLRLARALDWSALERAVCMARAMEVMAELNDNDALTRAAIDAAALVDELVGQDYPGPPFIVLRAILALKPKHRPAALDDLLDRVITSSIGSRNLESALALAARATSDEGRRHALRRRQLDVRIDDASSADGLAKAFRLQQATDFARRYQFPTEAAVLLKQLQDLPEEELGFETMEFSVDVPTAEVRAEVDLIVGSTAATLSDALDRLGLYGPPGGSNDDVDLDVEQQEKEFPIAGLFTQQLIGPGSSVPAFIASDAQGKRMLGRGRQRRIYVEYLGGVLIAPMLNATVRHHGPASQEQLTEHFATTLIGPERGERLGRSLQLYWEQQFDESAHVLVPRLESILRDIARADGIVISKPAQEGRFAGYISLSIVMAKLRELHADTPWLDYLEALLCDPLAINLRNDIAHGIIGRVGQVHAALLIQVACFVARITRADGKDSS